MDQFGPNLVPSSFKNFVESGIIGDVSIQGISEIDWSLAKSLIPGFSSSNEYGIDPTVTFSDRGQFYAVSTFELFYRKWLWKNIFSNIKILLKTTIRTLDKDLKMNYLGLNSVIEKVTNSSYGSPTQSRRGEKVAIHGTKSCGDQPK